MIHDINYNRGFPPTIELGRYLGFYHHPAEKANLLINMFYTLWTQQKASQLEI